MKYFRLAFRLLLIAGGIYGLYLNLRGPGAGILAYYTLQSNILVVAFFALIVAHALLGKKMPRALLAAKFSVTMAILVTGLVYHVLLVPQSFSMGSGFPSSLSSHLLHTFTPIMALVDMLLFDDLNVLRRSDPLWFVLIPYAYAAFAYLYSAGGGRFSGNKYPYFFMNVDQYGIGGVLLWFLGITAALLLLAYLLFSLVRLLRRKLPAFPA